MTHAARAVKSSNRCSRQPSGTIFRSMNESHLICHYNWNTYFITLDCLPLLIFGTQATGWLFNELIPGEPVGPVSPGLRTSKSLFWYSVRRESCLCEMQWSTIRTNDYICMQFIRAVDVACCTYQQRKAGTGVYSINPSRWSTKPCYWTFVPPRDCTAHYTSSGRADICLGKICKMYKWYPIIFF